MLDTCQSTEPLRSGQCTNATTSSGNGSDDARFWRAGKLHQGGHGMRAWLPLCRRGKVGSAVLQSRGEEARGEAAGAKPAGEAAIARGEAARGKVRVTTAKE